jgi:hypothetical protein
MPPSRRKLSWRSRLLRNWLLCAAPWLAGVVALSIHDHRRAIERAADLDSADDGLQIVVDWLLAVERYSGWTIVFYGVLPLALTFVLYVMFLPWADRWARQGLLED